MGETHILAGDQVVKVSEPADADRGRRAARYTTLAYGAQLATGRRVSNVPGWVAATYGRACGADPADLDAQMRKWATATRDRFELLGPVCDLLLRRSRRVDDRLVDATPDVPAEVEAAAVTLFGHPALSCRQPCRICAAALPGDWTRALRLSAGDATDLAAAALADGYRAARRGGHIPPVAPDAGVSGGYVWTPAAGPPSGSLAPRDQSSGPDDEVF